MFLEKEPLNGRDIERKDPLSDNSLVSGMICGSDSVTAVTLIFLSINN